MSKQTKYSKYTVLGVQVDRLSLSQALEEITQLAKSGPARYIVKPYVEHLDRASRQLAYRRLLNQAYLSLPDGVSLNWAVYFTRQTGRHWWDVITSLTKIFTRPTELHLSLPNYSWGTNFTWSLLESCAKKGLSVFLVGSPKGSDIAYTSRFLKAHIKQLSISGTMAGKDSTTGTFSSEMEQQLMAKLRQARADIILVGIGVPRQEQVIAKLAAQLPHGVLIGEGGTFDFDRFGGTIKKAPLQLQARGLEWLWRLIKEPHRLRRQLAIPRFIWKVYRHGNSATNGRAGRSKSQIR